MATLLIADDDPHVLMLSSLIFQAAGHHLIAAEDGEEAIEKALIEKPDLIISDILMPKKGGFELCKTIKANPNLRTIPVILFSAIRDKLYQENSLSAGATAFFQKPFDIDQLNTTVNQILNGKKVIESSPLETQLIEKESEKFSLKLPLQDKLKKVISEDSSLLLKGPIGSGKKCFIEELIQNYLDYNSGQVIWICLNLTPHQLIHRLRCKFGKRIDTMCTEKKLILLNATPSKRLNNEKWVIPIENHLDFTYFLDQIRRAKACFHPLFNTKKTCICIDSLTAFENDKEAQAFQNFIQLLSQSEEVGGQDLCLFLWEDYNQKAHIQSIERFLDATLTFKREGNNRLLKAQYLSNENLEWNIY